jgi:hypothetical protein
MKIREIVTESKKLDEAPMGMLSRAGRRVAASVGHSASAGALKTGEKANQMKKEYKAHLGEIGEKASKENLLNFLKLQGLPTAAAEQALDNVKPTTAQKVGGAVATVAKGLGGAVVGAAKGAVQGAKAATQKQSTAESLNNPPLSSAAIDQAITAAVQQKAKGQSASPAASASSGTTQQQTGPGAGQKPRHLSGETPNETPQTSTDTANKNKKTVKVTMKEIKEMIAGLSTADKKKLVKHLEDIIPLEKRKSATANSASTPPAQDQSQNQVVTPTNAPKQNVSSTGSSARSSVNIKGTSGKTARGKGKKQQPIGGKPAS